MLITNDQVFLDREFTCKDEVLAFIAREAAGQNIAGSEKDLLKDLQKREAEYSTAVQEGFAIPHAKSSTIKAAKLMFIRLADSIGWDSPDDYTVKAVFSILVPEQEAGTEHIRILSGIAVKLLEDDFKAAVLQAESEEDILKLLEEESQ